MNNKIEKLLSKRTEKYEINIGFMLLLMYTIFIVVNDYICFLGKIHANWMTYLISLILVSIPSAFLLARKIKPIKFKYSKFDCIFLLLIAFIYIIKFAIPDSAFDTLNYHLYLQENCFQNNVSYHFFPARWINTFSLPLADRMHNFFRYFLGYRLGNILNGFILIIIYFQVKEILENMISTNKKYVIPIFSGLIVCTEFILQNYITYYVDLFSIPFFLEIFIIMLKKEYNQCSILTTTLSVGIIVSLKISNAILLIPIGILYLFFARKNIKWYTLLAGVFFITFPLVIYVINNYIQTGNPFFPFYNSIFKSNYLESENWIEAFYGPKTLKERLLWPIYSLVDVRRANDNSIYFGRIAFGYVSSFVVLIYSVIRKDKKKIIGSALLIVLFLVWSNFMMGYIRYALILEILSGISIITVISDLFKKEKFINNIIAAIFAMLLFFQVTNSLHMIIYTGNELSWRTTIFENEKAYRKNLREVFAKVNYDENLEGVDCFGIVDYNSGYAVLLNEKIPSINLLESYKNDYGKEKYNEFLDNYKDKRIFVISTSKTISRTLQYLNLSEFKVDGEIKTFHADFLTSDDYIILMEVKRGDKTNNNNIYICKEENEKFLLKKNENNKIEFYYGNYPTLRNTGNDGYYVYIDLIDYAGKVKETVILDELDAEDFMKYKSIEINSNDIEEALIYYKNGENRINYNDWLLIIN